MCERWEEALWDKGLWVDGGPEAGAHCPLTPTLCRSWTSNTHVAVAQLPQQAQPLPHSTQCLALGWGRLGTLEPLPQVLQELNVTVVTFQCRPQNVCTHVPRRSAGICFVRTGGSGAGTAGTAPGRKGGWRGPSPAFSFLSSPSGRWAHPS